MGCSFVTMWGLENSLYVQRWGSGGVLLTSWDGRTFFIIVAGLVIGSRTFKKVATKLWNKFTSFKRSIQSLQEINKSISLQAGICSQAKWFRL